MTRDHVAPPACMDGSGDILGPLLLLVPACMQCSGNLHCQALPDTTPLDIIRSAVQSLLCALYRLKRTRSLSTW